MKTSYHIFQYHVSTPDTILKEVEIKEMLEYVQVLTIYVTVLRHFF